LRLDDQLSWDVPAHLSMLALARDRADEFDILHFHLDAHHLPLFHDIAGRTLTTMHGRQDIKDLRELHRLFPGFPLVSLSDSQRNPLPDLRWVRTIPHGYPKNQYAFLPHVKGDYLAFLGRIAPEKGVDRALDIARRTKIPLRIAAKVDSADRSYFNDCVVPLLMEVTGAKYIGEISDVEKSGFLGNARALLFPIEWPEPFGLVMIEAMACGTPVVAFNRGSVPEVIDDGVTGFIVETVEDAAEAVAEISRLNRAEIRATFERRFSVEAMAAGYEEAYRGVLAGQAYRHHVVEHAEPAWSIIPAAAEAAA
jgi:glycosyltransferase involved in cell wall biosynthesis